MTDLRRLMRGGGWCSLHGGEHVAPMLDEEAIDATWAAARSSLLDWVLMAGYAANDQKDPWPEEERARLAELQAAIQGAEPGTTFDGSFGPEGTRTRLALLPTPTAAASGAELQLLCRKGRKEWLEIGRLADA